MNKIVIKTIDINNPPELTQGQLERLAKLEQMDDSEIDFSDIAPLPDEFWINAVQNPFFKPKKQTTTVRIDADVLQWLKSQGKGYQTRLNHILRQAMIKDLTKHA